MLNKERAAQLGDPIRGVTTPFVQSFDTALPPEPTSKKTKPKASSNETPAAGPNNPLNFLLSKGELAESVERSKWLNTPLPDKALEDENPPNNAKSGLSAADSKTDPSVRFPKSDADTRSGLFSQPSSIIDTNWLNPRNNSSGMTPESTPEMRDAQRKQEQENAAEALRRISNLSLGSSKDRLRVNKQRCVEVYGRHNTDKALPPKPSGIIEGRTPEAVPRVGADTGSSEVQIAILTAKIRSLADFLGTRGRMDKINKRNLRLLVHRRAKLLQYLRRKERGGPRWQNLIETLGLTEGTWKGEISL